MLKSIVDNLIKLSDIKVERYSCELCVGRYIENIIKYYIPLTDPEVVLQIYFYGPAFSK